MFTISGLRAAVRDQSSTKTRNPKTLNPKPQKRLGNAGTLENPKKNAETLKRTLKRCGTKELLKTSQRTIARSNVFCTFFGHSPFLHARSLTHTLSDALLTASPPRAPPRTRARSLPLPCPGRSRHRRSSRRGRPRGRATSCRRRRVRALQHSKGVSFGNRPPH